MDLFHDVHPLFKGSLDDFVDFFVSLKNDDVLWTFQRHFASVLFLFFLFFSNFSADQIVQKPSHSRSNSGREVFVDFRLEINEIIEVHAFFRVFKDIVGKWLF